MPDDPPAADATEHDMADHLAAIAQQSQRIAARFLSGQGAMGAGAASDPLNLGAALGAMARSLTDDPTPLIDAQMKWWDGYLRLWQQGAQRVQGEEPAEPVAAPAPDDPALSRSCLDRELGLRSPEAVVPADRRLYAVGGGEPARPRREGRRQARLLHAPVRRCAGADQFPRHQPGGAQGDCRDQGRELVEGPAQRARRPGAQRGPVRAPHVGRGSFHSGRDHRHDARKGRLPERPDAADPVRAGHGDGVSPAAPDRAALDQQVLRARPPAQEFVSQVGGVEGLHGLP